MNSTHKHNHLLPVLSILCSMTSIQLGAAVAKQMFPFMDTQAVTMLRLSLGTMALFMFWRPWEIFKNKPAGGNYPWLSLFLYGLSLAGMNSFFYMALERIPLGIAIAFEFSGPLAIALIRLRRLQDVIWVIFALAGMWLLLPLSDNVTQLDPLGILYALGAGSCWALYILSAQKAGVGLPSGVTTTLGMCFATILFLPVGMTALVQKPVTWSLLGMGLSVAILSSALPYVLEMKALKELPAQTFGILMSLSPAIGALIGVAFLGELLTPKQWLAIAFVIIASAGTTLTLRDVKTADVADAII